MKKLKINLFNQTTIQQAIKDIQDYKQELINNTKKFCEELSKIGIEVINANISNEFRGYIGFSKKVNPQQYGCEEILILEDIDTYESKWLALDENGKETEKTAKLSAVLLAEFGSGIKADAERKHMETTHVKEKVGRGTFPSETNEPFGNINHARRQKIWSYKDTDEKWKRSSGVAPTMPMYNAYIEMERQIKEKAREIFKQ